VFNSGVVEYTDYILYVSSIIKQTHRLMLYTLYEAIPVWYEFVWTLIKDVDVCI